MIFVLLISQYIIYLSDIPNLPSTPSVFMISNFSKKHNIITRMKERELQKVDVREAESRS